MTITEVRHWVFDMDGTLTIAVHDFAAIRRALEIPEEDDILQNLKQQAQRGTRSSASYDPDASSNFGKTTASSDGTPNFESMRDAFREAGMEVLETKSPVAAPPKVTLRFGAPLPSGEGGASTGTIAVDAAPGVMPPPRREQEYRTNTS